jgi:hypothetical protein
VPFDFHPASGAYQLVLYDPAAMPADLPVDPDLRTDQPEPPPTESVETLAQEGRAFVVEMPRKWDGEADFRVFVDEELPEPLAGRGALERRVTGAVLDVPEGLLVADGAEFIELPGSPREHASDLRVQIPAGRYALEAFDTFPWKIQHRDGALAAHTTWLERMGHRLVVAMVITALLLIPATILALIFVASMAFDGRWDRALRLGLLIALVDVVVFGAVALWSRFAERNPEFDVSSKVANAGTRFDEETPDIVVVLRRIGDLGAGGGTPAPGLLRVVA